MRLHVLRPFFLLLRQYRSSLLRLIFVLIFVYLLIFFIQQSTPSAANSNPIKQIKNVSIHNKNDCPAGFRFLNSNWILLDSSNTIDDWLRFNIEWNIILFTEREKTENCSQSSRVLCLDIDGDPQTNYSVLNSFRRISSSHHRLRHTRAVLLAIRCGAKLIFEADSNKVIHIDVYSPSHIKSLAFHGDRSHFVNLVGSLSDGGNITSTLRGFPVSELVNVTEDGWYSFRAHRPDLEQSLRPLIQQYIHSNFPKMTFALEPLSFSPFFGNNTLWHYDAFWGLLLTGDGDDVWRGYWVQRILAELNAHVIFVPTRRARIELQNERNFSTEYDRNLLNFVHCLTRWKIEKNRTLFAQIKSMSNQCFSTNDDLQMIDTWLETLNQISYKSTLIPIISESEKRNETTSIRTVVCVTGVSECVNEGWGSIEPMLRSRLSGQIDVFLYLSSSLPHAEPGNTPVPHNIRLSQVLAYPDTTVKVLFENRPIAPNISCENDPDTPSYKLPRYWQQLYGLSRCYELVKDYEKKMNVRYSIFIRSRVDIVLGEIPSTFDRKNPYDLNTTILIPFNHYYDGIDDGWAIGPIDHMEKYMNRYYTLEKCLRKDIHPERYLWWLLENYYKVQIKRDDQTSDDHIKHGFGFCH